MVKKADRHIGTLLLLGPKDQLSYIFGRSKTAIGGRLGQTGYKRDTHNEGSSSRALQVVYEANLQALRNYVPLLQNPVLLFLR